MANKIKSNSSHSNDRIVRNPRAKSPHARFSRERRRNTLARSISLNSGLKLPDASLDPSSEVTISYMGNNYSARKIFPDGHDALDDDASEGSLDCNDLMIESQSSHSHGSNSSLRIPRAKPSIFEAMSKSITSFGSSVTDLNFDDTPERRTPERRAPARSTPARRKLPVKSFTGSSLESMRRSIAGRPSAKSTSSTISSIDDQQIKRMLELFGYTDDDVKNLTEDEERFSNLKDSLKSIGAVTNTSLMMGLHIYLRKEKRRVSLREKETNAAA